MTPPTNESAAIVSTGNVEIDKKLGGGIPAGSFTLIEGHSDAGKSVLAQHLASGALQSGLGVCYYSTENTVKSLLTQMASLNLDVTDYFLVDRLRIHPLTIIRRNIGALPGAFVISVVDSVTNLVTHSKQSSIIHFFNRCKELCDHGRTVFMVVHTYAFDDSMLIRVRSLCDAHLRLRLEEVGERLVKVLEVSKVRNADRSTGNIISFDVEPGMGMRILPMTKARA